MMILNITNRKTIQAQYKANSSSWYTLTAIVLVLLFSGCSPTFESKWRSSNEQETPETFAEKKFGYDQDAGIMYHFSNSEDTLFVDLKFTDRFTAMRVRRFGFTLWIDPEARKKQEYGIVFPLRDKNRSGLSSSRSQLPEVVEDEDGFKRLKYPDNKKAQLNSKLIKDNFNLMLKGFGEKFEETILPAGEAPVEAKLFYDASENLSYHLAIPLSKINIKKNLAEQVLSVGMITGKPKNKNQQETQRRSPGQGGTGGVMPGSSQRQQRMTSRPSATRNPATTLWIKKVYLTSGK